jgi:hypothetical protein
MVFGSPEALDTRIPTSRINITVVCFARDDVRQPSRARQVRGDNVILKR